VKTLAAVTIKQEQESLQTLASMREHCGKKMPEYKQHKSKLC
jgi:hypothetical protein